MAGNILGSLLLNIVTKSDDSGLRKTDKSLRKIGTTAKTVAKNTSLLGSLSKRFMGGFNISNIGNWFNSYLQFEKDLGAMQSRFYAITHSEKESAEEFEYIRKLATDTALDIKKTADSYSIFYSATRNALGKEGARGVYEAWTQVGRVLHLSDYQMERVTYALREMASKGAIYSQDLRMQIGTHVPNAMGLAQKAAEEMGYTGVDWFTKLQEAAKGNTKLTADFVQKFSKQAQMMYASPEALKKAMQQPDALAKQITNFRYNFGVEFSKAGGSYMVVKILQGTLEFIKTIPFYYIADKLGTIAKTIGDMAIILPEILNILKDIAIIYIGNMIVKSFGRIFSKDFKNSFGKSLLINLRYIFKNGLMSGIKNIGKGILNSFKYFGFGRIVPFIGQALLVFDIIKLLYKSVKSLIPEKEDVTTEKFTTTLGLTPEQVQSIITTVKAKGVTSQEDLDRKLMWYKGGERLVGALKYEDNSEITINIDGTDVKATQIADYTVDRLKQEKSKNTFFNKPVSNSRGGVDLEALYGK